MATRTAVAHAPHAIGKLTTERHLPTLQVRGAGDVHAHGVGRFYGDGGAQAEPHLGDAAQSLQHLCLRGPHAPTRLETNAQASAMLCPSRTP